VVEVAKRLLEPAKLFIRAELAQELVNSDPDRSAAGRFGSVGYQLPILVKATRQEPVNGAGIGSALGLFVLKLVGFAEHIDRDPDVVIGKSINGMGIMQQYVRIKNVILDLTGMTVP
jgi:hypothetical protein